MITQNDLEKRFSQALEGTVLAAKNAGYYPSYFSQMLSKYSGVQTAKRLLSSSKTQEGLDKLWELGLLSESMEAVVMQECFKSLFTDEERGEALKRLQERGYKI